MRLFIYITVDERRTILYLIIIHSLHIKMPISYAYANGRCLGSAGHGAAGNGHLGLQTAGDTEKSLTVQWEGGDLMYKCILYILIYIYM